LTQAELADRLRVSRDWVVRLEKGSPRLETQKVLDALSVLGLTLEVTGDQPVRKTAAKKRPTTEMARSVTTGRFVTQGSAAKKAPGTTRATPRALTGAVKDSDPFGFLTDRTS